MLVEKIVWQMARTFFTSSIVIFLSKTAKNLVAGAKNSCFKRKSNVDMREND